jgi:phosphatidate cytidylyltransferase
MLSTRLLFGLLMVAGLLVSLWVDEWFAPWFPLWFVLSASALVAAALELNGLLEATSARPSANSVIGGVLAILVANWAPHLTGDPGSSLGVSA